MLTCASSLSGILGNPVGPERPLDTGFVTASPLQIQITSLPPATLTLTGPGAHQALIWLGLVWPHWHGLAPSCWHGLASPHRGLRLHQERRRRPPLLLLHLLLHYLLSLLLLHLPIPSSKGKSLNATQESSGVRNSKTVVVAMLSVQDVQVGAKAEKKEKYSLRTWPQPLPLVPRPMPGTAHLNAEQLRWKHALRNACTNTKCTCSVASLRIDPYIFVWDGWADE